MALERLKVEASGLHQDAINITLSELVQGLEIEAHELDGERRAMPLRRIKDGKALQDVVNVRFIRPF
jgi:hypothetical protein